MAGRCDGDISTDDELQLAAIALFLVQKKRKRKRPCWAREWLQKRPKYGAYSCLLQELLNDYTKTARNFLRMSQDNFAKLLEVVGPHIQKQDTVMREAIKPAERPAITLRYLASGNTFMDLKYLFRVSNTTEQQIVLETCKAIYTLLKDEYLKVPRTPEEWRRIANEFEARWQFPNCIGAMDGKHIHIMAPNEGSKYYNYQGYHSIILLALVGPHYQFLYVDVGANGRAGDAGVFRDSPLAKGLQMETLGIPSPDPLPGREKPVPFFIVADDAFPLKPYIMKPYPFRNVETQNCSIDESAEAERRKQRIFDYRLSRARRISENAFGILAARFGIFQHAMRLSPENATAVTLACLVLHNFLIAQNDKVFATPSLLDREQEGSHELQPGEWRQNQQTYLHRLDRQAGNRCTSDARAVRNEVKEYVNMEGQVPWQSKLVFGTD